MRPSTSTAVAFGFLVSSITRGLAEDCIVRKNGKIWDLSPLSSKNDYEFNSTSNRRFVLNVCQSISTRVWNPKVDRTDDIAGFTTGAHGDLSMGDVNKTVLVRDNNPVLLMTEGSACPTISSMQASTAIRFICDESAGIGIPSLIAQLPPDDDTACAFFIEWRTKVACPFSESRAGAIIGIITGIIFGCFLLYVIGGMIYNRFYRGLRGFDQVPRFSLFSFSNIKDHLHDFITCITHSDPWTGGWNGFGALRRQFGSGRGNWDNRHRDGFQRVPSSREESESILGPEGNGRFSLEDDEDDDQTIGNGYAHGPPRGMNREGIIRL